MIDREGKPLTDPKRADEGHLLPIGDYKGSGLSLIIGLLAGTLNRAAIGREVVDFVKEAGKATNTGHAIAAIVDRDVHAGRRIQARRRSSDPRYPQFAAPARRRAHLAAGRAEPRQAAGPPRARHPDAESRCATASMPWRAISTSRRWM